MPKVSKASERERGGARTGLRTFYRYMHEQMREEQPELLYGVRLATNLKRIDELPDNRLEALFKTLLEELEDA